MIKHDFASLLRRVSFCLALGFSAALLAATPAAPAIRLADKLPMSPDLKKGVLPNGLTYYIQKNARPANKVELRLVVKAGSVLEDDDQQGLAHFVEHMAFQGSTHFKGHELVSYLQDIGVKFGADLNAYTGFTETVYVLPVPTDKKDNLDKGFTVLEDWAGGLAFDHAAIDKERGVILEEARLGKGAGERMRKQTLPKILAGSRYAERLPIGKEDIIKNFSYEALTRFYADWYRPGLMAVVVVGDVEPEAAEAMVKAHFSHLKNPAVPRPLPVNTLAARAATEAIVVTDREAASNEVAILSSRLPDPAEETYGAYRGRLVAQLFNDMLGQRLQEIGRNINPPFVRANSRQSRVIPGYREFESSAVIGKAGPLIAINALVAENERVLRYGFSSVELERSKKNLLRSFERGYNERDKAESGPLVAEFIRNFVEREAVPGIAAERAITLELLPAITLEDVTALAQLSIAGNGNRLVIYQGSGTGDFVHMSPAQLLAAVTDAANVGLRPYEEKALASELMVKAPVGGKLLAEKQIPELGVTELTLANGVKVWLKPSDFKNDQVILTATRHGGASLFPDADVLNLRYVARMVTEMGVGDFSPADIGKILAGKSASGGPFIGELSEGFNGQSGSADVETLLQLAYLFFTQPRRDEALFQSSITRQRDAIRNLGASPQYIYAQAMIDTAIAPHPRRPTLPKSEDFDKLSMDRMLEIYKQRFASARGFTFIVAGSFEVEKIKPLLVAYLGSLPGGPIDAHFKDVGLRAVTGVVKKEVFAGSEQKSAVALMFNGETPYSPEAGLKLSALAEILKVRLNESLREKMGAVYTSNVTAALQKYPYGSYVAAITLPCAPENVDRLIAASLAELDKIRNEGVLPADLSKVKLAWLKSHREGMRSNSYWTQSLRSYIEQDIDPLRLLTYEARLDALGVQDIQDAAKQYFDMKNFVQVVLYPAKK